MRIFIMVMIVLISISPLALADTIHLKNGRIVEGTITERTKDQIKIDVNGFTLTYYLDEIEEIEGVSVQITETESPAMLPSITQGREQKQEPARFGSSTTKAINDLNLSAMNKRDLVLHYMEVTGVKGQMNQSFSEIIQRAPEQERRNLRRVLKSKDVLDELVPVYAQYFSEDDLRELILFYESEVGQKLLKTAPLIMQESAEKSLQYFEGKIE